MCTLRVGLSHLLKVAAGKQITTYTPLHFVVFFFQGEKMPEFNPTLLVDEILNDYDSDKVGGKIARFGKESDITIVLAIYTL